MIRSGVGVLCGRGRWRLFVLALVVPVLTLAGAAAAQAATLRPNTTADEMTPHDGTCSLREAIDAANSPGTKNDCGTADPSFNYVVLGAKTYQLSISPGPEDTDNNCLKHPKLPPDQNATGDLCVTSRFELTIVGKGPQTVIAGKSTLADRLMTIAPRALVFLNSLKMKGGHAPDGPPNALGCTPTPPSPTSNGANGGAIYNAGTLSANVVTFKGNSAGVGGAGDTSPSDGCAGGNGGAIYNDGTTNGTKTFPGSLTVQNSMFISNAAGAGGAGGTSAPGGNGGSGGSGGGIYNNSGSVVVLNSTFSSNNAGTGGQGGTGSGSGDKGGDGGDGSPGGGIFSTGGSLSVSNATFATNQAGSGGNGGDFGGGSAKGGNGGDGADGGAVAVVNGASGLRNATVYSNDHGTKGTGGTGTTAGSAGKDGIAGGIFVQSSTMANDMDLQNTIVASNAVNCLGSSSSAISDAGHNLNFPATDTSCPPLTNGDPKLKPLADYGGYTSTLALAPGSPAIGKVPRNGAGCPSTDERTVRRPQGSACDIGAFEFARPRIEIDTPRNGASYKRGSAVHASYRCTEGGITSPLITPIKTCTGTVANGHLINTSTLGQKSFKVTATDKSGNTTSKTVHYTVIR